jgi:hypothetical protein
MERNCPQKFIQKKCTCSTRYVFLVVFSSAFQVTFYKAKQGGEEVNYVEAFRISPAEGVFVWFYLGFRVTDVSSVEIAICK